MKLTAVGPRHGTPERIQSTQVQRNRVQWGKLLVKLTFWAASELLLSWVGLDNLADYGEFVLGQVDQISALYQILPAQQGSLDASKVC
jgi:hypothetical protein